MSSTRSLAAQVPGLLGSLCRLRVSYGALQPSALAAWMTAGPQLVSACRNDATPVSNIGSLGAVLATVRHQSGAAHQSSSGRPKGWEQLQQDGHRVNPCNSPNHPAVVQGVLPTPEGDELSVQEAYNPESSCFGCGPSSPDGLQLRSHRMPGEGLGRLEARVTIPSRYCAFPGIVNGGILSTLMDCHGNWAAAVCLMDKGCLPRPPLTLTASMSVIFKEPTPPDTELILRSRVLSLRESAAASGSSSGGGTGAYGSSGSSGTSSGGGGAYGSSSGNKMAQAQAQKATVEVEVVVLQPLDAATAAAAAPPSSSLGPVQGAETAAAAAGAAGVAGAGDGSQGFVPGHGTGEPPMKILAVGRGVFKRLGALRAL